MKEFLNKVNVILASKSLFWVILVVFILSAAWIALSAVYPQAFDENFHFGLIQVYSHYWLPFLTHQPPNANAYGAVARDPSYLYHYLMSFPYRVIKYFDPEPIGQIIMLRFINIGLFSSGLVLFRQVLHKARVSVALSNLILMVFVLIPITPQLAAHINYDNMLFPLVAGVCLLMFNVIDQLGKKKPNARSMVLLLIVCLFASIVKYVFLPIFFGVVLFTLYLLYKNYHGQYTRFGKSFWKSWCQQSWYKQSLLILLLIVSLGMFIQRDGINIVEYHAIIPDCSKVLNVKDCSAYSPWNYDYVTHKKLLEVKPGVVHFYNPISYMGVWLYWMWYRLFFAINGQSSGFKNYPPLPLPSAAAVIVGVAGVIVALVWRRVIFRNNPYLLFFFVIGFTYTAALWLDGYSEYHYTHVLQAMNGRYLLPVLILYGAILGRAFSIALRNMPIRKTVFAVVVIFFFLQGGGVLTFIARSDPSWYWNNKSVDKANHVAQKITRPVIIKGKQTYQTHVWFYN